MDIARLPVLTRSGCFLVRSEIEVKARAALSGKLEVAPPEPEEDDDEMFETGAVSDAASDASDAEYELADKTLVASA